MSDSNLKPISKAPKKVWINLLHRDWWPEYYDKDIPYIREDIAEEMQHALERIAYSIAPIDTRKIAQETLWKLKKKK